MASLNMVNIGLSNGFLPDGTMPLPEAKLINSQWGIHHIQRRAMSQEMLKKYLLDMSLKIIYLKLQLQFLGAKQVK